MTGFGLPDRGGPPRNQRGENQRRRTRLTFGLQSCVESISTDTDSFPYAFEPSFHESSPGGPSCLRPATAALINHGAAHRNARDAEASAVHPVVQPDQLAKLGARVQSCTAVPQATYMPAGSPRAKAHGTPSSCSQLHRISHAWCPSAKLHSGAPSDIHTSRKPAS